MSLKEQLEFDMNGGIDFTIDLTKNRKVYKTKDGKPLHELAAKAYDEYGIGEPYIVVELPNDIVEV